MNAYDHVWGLDIGFTSIKAVKLGKSGDSLTVLDYTIEAIPQGESVDRDQAVVQALKNIATSENIAGAPVVISLSGRQIFARTINIPITDKRNILKMVKLEAQQQIPGDFTQVKWDYHLSPSLDGSTYDVALFAAKQEIIDEIIRKSKEANLNLVGISVTSLALYNFIRYDQDFSTDESIVVLDVGAENTDLVIYKGDTLWIRNLGLSGNDITRAFMKKFRVSFEEAESLKCQVAESRQADKIFKVIEGSLAELSSDVQRSLGFYKSQNEGAVFQNVVVAGNTFKLPGLTQYMADRLGYAIISLVELEKIKVDESLDRQQFLEDLQSLGVSIGLAMQGLGAAQANINLLPKDLRIQSMLKTKVWAMVAVLVLIAAAKFLSYYAANKNLGTVQDEIVRMAKLRTNIERDINETKAKMDDLAKAVAPLNIYRGYGLHRGFLHCVSSQTMGVFHNLATQNLVYKDPPKPEIHHKDGGDPALQPIYLQTLAINEQRANVGQTVFLPSQPPTTPNGKPESRELIVEALIPQSTLMPQNSLDSNKIREKLKEDLIGLKVSREYFQVIDPLEQNAEAPPLFESVVTTKEGESNTIQWFYIDRYKTDAKGNILSEPERFMKKSVPAIRIELKCTINPQILRTVR